MVHAGGKDGVFPGLFWNTRRDLQLVNYHKEMNEKNFEKWLKEKLLPNLSEKRVIVMDSASCHSVQVETCMSTNTRKREIQERLRHKNVNFLEDMMKAELLNLVELNKPVEPT